MASRGMVKYIYIYTQLLPHFRFRFLPFLSTDGDLLIGVKITLNALEGLQELFLSY